MFNRVTTLFVVLAIFVCGAPSLHAQSLSPDQEAKLDARLEHIVEKANQGKLEAAIDRFSEKMEDARQKARSEYEKSAEGEMNLNRYREKQERKQKIEYPAFSPENVTPAARKSNGTPVYEAVVYTQNASSLEGSGITVASSLDGFATVRATPKGLQKLSALNTVDQVHSPRRARPHNDEAAAQAGVRVLNNGIGGTEYTGKDVMTCVIDSGIDWDHPDFTNDEGQSRVRYIWDQQGDARGIGPPKLGDFDPRYGDGYGPADIRSGNVEQIDGNGHGTHVAGTAVSSGNAHEQTKGVEKYKGMAPDADIVAVKTSFSNVAIIDAVNYCKRLGQAEGKPVVANLSLGTIFRPGDGTAPDALGIEQLTAGGTESGMVVVSSAGNSGGSEIHSGPHEAAAGDSADVNMTVGPPPAFSFFNFGFAAVLWSYSLEDYSLSVYTPQMQDTLTVDIPAMAATDSSLVTPRGNIRVFSAPRPLGGNRAYQIIVDDVPEESDLADGEWTFRIRNDGDTDTKVHGWQFAHPNFFVVAPEGTAFTDADRLYTLGSPSTSRGAISVGSYTHRTRWSTFNGTAIGFSSAFGIVRDSISSFSSRGPMVNDPQKPEIQKPEITASGEIMVSAFSQDGSPAFGAAGLVDEYHQGLQGTSMSSPTVAGSVALLLQEDPTLSTEQVRNMLAQTARVDDAVERRGGAWNPVFGNGKLNALGALTQLRQGGQGATPLEVLSYHDEPFLFATEDDPQTPEDESTPDYTAADTLGGSSGADSLALRFTPTTGGFVSGAYLSVASNEVEETSEGEVVVSDSANKLTDALHVQVYTDANGTPGTAVGDPVDVPPAQLKSFQSQFVSLDGAGASVNADTDYHLVVTTGEEEQGSIRMLAETKDDNSGRSMMMKDGSWSGTDNDLAMRVQVSGSVTAPAAVAGAEFTSEEPGNVSISWSEVADAAQYNVYRSTESVPKATSGLDPFDTVEAGTTTFTDEDPTTGQTYYYRVAAVNDRGSEGPSSSEIATFLYPQSVTADINRSFGEEAAGASGSSYRLVAMPGSADQPLAETLDGEAGLDWQAYAHESSGLVPFDGSDTFTLSAGNGFWLTSTSTWSSNAEVSTVELNANNKATISLSDGWNVVSNPTDKDVPFWMIQAAHADTLQGMWAFDGTWHAAETMRSAKSGVAYYFNNTTGLDELTIPYPGAPMDGESMSAPKKAEDAPALALSARPEAADGPASTVKMDFAANASTGLDAQDLIAPTGHFEEVSLRLKSPATNGESSRNLLVERRPVIDAGASNGHTFDLQLNSEVNGAIEISARNLVAVEDYEVSLIHGGETHDLRRTEQVAITPDGETTSLKLAVGTKAYVEGQVEDVIPEKMSLSSYPNPLRQQATVEYALPEAEEVRLVLYDVLGREVAVLENGRKDAGHHTVSLDGGQLSSGVYFGRLKAGDKQLTKKITVVR